MYARELTQPQQAHQHLDDAAHERQQHHVLRRQVLRELVREQGHERRGPDEHLLDGADEHVYESSQERRVQPGLNATDKTREILKFERTHLLLCVVSASR